MQTILIYLIIVYDSMKKILHDIFINIMTLCMDFFIFFVLGWVEGGLEMGLCLLNGRFNSFDC